jgi:transcription initiation factor TFIID subunit 5
MRRLYWPIFIYSYFHLVEEFFTDESQKFFNYFKGWFVNEHADDLRKLEPVRLPEHIKEAEIVKIYRGSKYRLTVSQAAFYNMVQYLESKDIEGGHVILAVIHQWMNVVAIERAQDDRYSLAKLMARSKVVEDFPAEDEGIPGHNPGSANIEQSAGSTILTRLKLGPLPMEPELIEDVMAELEEEDSKNPPPEGVNTLLEEFKQHIKREEGEDIPNRTDIPIPASLSRDVIMEVQKVKENRDRFKIEGRTGGVAPAVSVCMFTFHNTYGQVTCIDISGDNQWVAVGTAEHYIRVFDLEGKPLASMFAGEPPEASRRLIGHSAPVYNVSFSPSIAQDREFKDMIEEPHTRPRFLLSCSADKTIRLWHMGLWQCLVVYRGHMGPVWDVCWGPFGHYFLTGSHDKCARLWSTENISCLRMFVGHDQDVSCVAFHPNNAYVFTGSDDKTVRMWAVSNGYSVRMFTGHTGYIMCIACSPSGKLLASADDQGTIILWDLAAGRLVKRMRGHGKGAISLSWSAESTVLLSGSIDGTVRVWDVAGPSDAPGQGRVLESGPGSAKIDAATGTAQTPASAGVAGASGAAGAGGGQLSKKRGKEEAVSADQISAFPTKKSPVYKVKFTRMNLAVAAGCYSP